MPLNTGAVLANRYRTVQLLGKGGFGAVYRGWDINLQLRCAIKENTDISDEGKRQFFREAQILATLSHPNLPRVTDHFFVPNQGQYLVMDFIDGEDLDTLLTRSGPVPEETLLPWIGQIVDALHYLHSQNPQIIHRDVKPANIRITPQGKAVLVDFGIAKIFGTGTMTAARAVTPGFSPPEQYLMTGTTAQSDIYSLGATMYTLLTGQVLPSGPRPPVVQPPAALNPGVSQRTSWVVMKALEADPKKRFQSVLEIKRALNIALGMGQVIPTVQPVSGTAPSLNPYAMGAPQSGPASARQAPVAQQSGSTPPPPPHSLGKAGKSGAARGGKSNSSKTVLIVLGVFLLLCIGLAGGAAVLFNSLTGSLTGLAPEATRVSDSRAGSLATATDAPESKLPTATTAASEPTATTAAALPTATAAAVEPTATMAPAAAGPGAPAVEISSEPAGQSGIRVEVRNAENKPLEGLSIGIYLQEKDLNGNPVNGDHADSGWTNESGIYEADLTPGTYAINLSNDLGLPIDPHYNYTVQAGQMTVVRVKLGRIRVGIMDVDGQPVEGKYTSIAFQQGDINGNPVIGDPFRSAYTDQRGLAEFGLFPGTYAVKIDGLSGMPWGEETNHIVEPGKITSILVQLSRVVIGVVDADGKPLESVYVKVHYQGKDIQGNPALGDSFHSGYTNNAGSATWNITPGTYAVQIEGIRGYAWNNVYNHTLAAGKTETVVLQLGRMTVAVKDGAGNPVDGQYVVVYTQKADVNGNPTKDESIWSGYTDNTGAINLNLTPGAYMVLIKDNPLMNIPVEPGKTTITDGNSAWFK